MKAQIKQTKNQEERDIKYPCVMVSYDPHIGEVVIATDSHCGLWMDDSGDGQATWHNGGGSWLDAGFVPATSPVTVTLTNE